MFGCDELVPELLLQSLLFSSFWVLAVPSVLQCPVLGKDSYSCLGDKSSSVPPQLISQIHAIPFNVCRPVPLHTLCLWERIVAHSVESCLSFIP